MPQIKVTIDKFGKSNVSVEGETGEGCVAATASIEAALAGSVNRSLKPEFDEQPQTANTQTVGGNW